ncbi:IQ motif and SEC7 domain-containing protein 1 isoform X1, partial [Clarias magur]
TGYTLRRTRSVDSGTLHQYCCPAPLYNTQLAVPAPLKECRSRCGVAVSTDLVITVPRHTPQRNQRTEEDFEAVLQDGALQRGAVMAARPSRRSTQLLSALRLATCSFSVPGFRSSQGGFGEVRRRRMKICFGR